MPDLREALAHRFANIFLPRLGDGTPYDGLRQFQKEEWRKLADECIRQMQWAWHACRWASPATMTWQDTLLEDGDMTCGAAPEDWKPSC